LGRGAFETENLGCWMDYLVGVWLCTSAIIILFGILEACEIEMIIKTIGQGVCADATR
jgi:hypothetical protein